MFLPEKLIDFFPNLASSAQLLSKELKSWMKEVQFHEACACVLQMDLAGRSNEVTRRWRLDGEQQDTLSEKRYIRPVEFLPFLPASFVIL